MNQAFRPVNPRLTLHDLQKQNEAFWSGTKDAAKVDRSRALELMRKANMKPFSKNDYMAFSGVESNNPKIGEAEGYTVILDGNYLEIIDDNGNSVYRG